MGVAAGVWGHAVSIQTPKTREGGLKYIALYTTEVQVAGGSY